MPEIISNIMIFQDFPMIFQIPKDWLAETGPGSFGKLPIPIITFGPGDETSRKFPKGQNLGAVCQLEYIELPTVSQGFGKPVNIMCIYIYNICIYIYIYVHVYNV